MTVEFNRHFLKDLDRLPTAAVKSDVADVIESIERAVSLSEVANVKKLKGFKTAYRIRVGDFRIGMVVVGGVVELVRVVDRKDIYRLFP